MLQNNTISLPYDVTKNSRPTRHERHLNQLLNIAAAIEEPVGKARLAASIVMYNSVIAYGISQYKTHPLQSRFSSNSEAISLHAEICAIKNALRTIDLSDLSKCTLYIARSKYSDQDRTSIIPGLAKPCSGCMRAIATFGIKKVIYTLDNSGWTTI